MASFWKSTAVTLEMIKWEHSVFALPFALTGAVLAAGGWPTLRVLCWIVVCMLAARWAAMLIRLTLELAPAAVAVVLVYSYMKRITRWSHLVLGLALGIAPTAAWIAVRGSLDWRIVVLTGAVLLWVGGFEVLYACQDFEHDRKVGLNSVPQAFGLVPAFWIARAMHVGMLLMLCWLVVLFGLGKLAVMGVAVGAIVVLC